MARQCRKCAFCGRRARAQTARSIMGRRMYYCAHPRLSDLPASVFRNMDPGFIGLGEATAESRLTLKTHPRWCPMELFHDK